jgi:hypothetical protein
MNNVAASVGTTMKPAGFDNVQGVLTAAWLKDPTDHQWDNEPDMKEWRAFMAKYIPDGFVGLVFGASVKQFSSGNPHSREFWAMATRLSSSVQSAAANHTDRPVASFISME